MPMAPLQHEPRRILILHLGSLAEVILSLPALQALRERFSRAHITLAAAAPACQTVAMTSIVDEFLTIDTHHLSEIATPWGLYRWIRLTQDIQQGGYDWTIDLPSYGQTSILTKLTRARVRWMAQPPTRAVDFLAHLWPLKNDRRQYMIERYFDVMRPFGIQPEQHRPVLHPPPDVSAATDKRLSQKGHRRGQLLIGLYPHADDGPRHWPLDWFVELSQRLVHDLDVQLLLLSYSRKHKIIRNIAKSVAKNITLDGLTMPELAAALTACTMLITDDAGIANLAAAVDTPVLGLGVSASVAPRGEEHIVIQSGRLASTLEEVMAAASQIVSRERSSTLFQK